MEYIDLEAFFRDGYAVVRVLDTEEAAAYAAVADAWLEEADGRDFLQVAQLPAVLEHPVVQGAIAQILGGTDLVLETWRLMAVEVGEAYRQGWHRDIPLGAPWMPEKTATRLLEAIAEGRWWHNNVQCNLALNPDPCYWTVPGSNARAFTAQERAVFDPIIADQTHLASRPAETDAGIPDGVCVEIEPGEMILQHNVGIHRGWGTPLKKPRRTLHFGFHAAHRPPTWHFRRRLNDTYDNLSAVEQKALHPAMRALLERRARRMAEFNASEPGDNAWRQANEELFFTGGLQD